MSKLLIGCHPDDEIIFAGALLLRERDWKVLCLTHGDGPRARSFMACMASLGIDAEIRSLPDSPTGFPDRERLVATVREAGLPAYDRVVTHGLAGEYGHRQHIELSLLVHGLRPDAESFSFARAHRLPAAVLAAKRDLLKRFYGDRKIAWLSEWIECESTAARLPAAAHSYQTVVPNFLVRAWRQHRW